MSLIPGNSLVIQTNKFQVNNIDRWIVEYYKDLEEQLKIVHKKERLTEKNLNDNLETPHLAPALFSHLPGFYLKTGILNPFPFLLKSLLRNTN